MPFKLIKSLARVGLLYLLIFFILMKVFDQNQVVEDVLNASRPSVDYVHAFSLGLKPFDKAELKRAKAYYQTLLSGSFSLSAMHANLGFCQFYLGEKKAALNEYLKALSMDQDMYTYYMDLGTIYQSMNQHQKAQEMFQKANFLIPESKEALLGVLHISERFRQESIFEVYFRERVPHDRKMIYLKLLSSLNELKADEAMIRYAINALKLFPNDPEFYYEASLAAYRLGYIDQSMALIVNCLKVEPRFAKAYELRSLLMRHIGNEAASIDDQRESERLKQKDGWRRVVGIQDIHHWEENVLLFQIYR